MASWILGNSVNVQVYYKLEKLLIAFVFEIIVNKAFSYLLLDFYSRSPMWSRGKVAQSWN